MPVSSGRQGTAAVVSVMKNDLFFVFSGFYSTLLPEAGCDASLGGRHRPVLVRDRHGILTPPRISPSRPHCVIPLFTGL